MFALDSTTPEALLWYVCFYLCEYVQQTSRVNTGQVFEQATGSGTSAIHEFQLMVAWHTRSCCQCRLVLCIRWHLEYPAVSRCTLKNLQVAQQPQNSPIAGAGLSTILERLCIFAYAPHAFSPFTPSFLRKKSSPHRKVCISHCQTPHVFLSVLVPRPMTKVGGFRSSMQDCVQYPREKLSIWSLLV